MLALYIGAVVTWGFALARIDFAQHRLPDRLTLPAIPVAIAVVAYAWPDRTVTALQWGIVLTAGATILALVADLGWGDVKLIASLGILAAGADAIAESTTMICLAAGTHLLVHLLVDGDRRAHIPFGPALLLGFGPPALAMA